MLGFPAQEGRVRARLVVGLARRHRIGQFGAVSRRTELDPNCERSPLGNLGQVGGRCELGYADAVARATSLAEMHIAGGAGWR